jgi:hypothetical protein
MKLTAEIVSHRDASYSAKNGNRVELVECTCIDREPPPLARLKDNVDIRMTLAGFLAMKDSNPDGKTWHFGISEIRSPMQGSTRMRLTGEPLPVQK